MAAPVLREDVLIGKRKAIAVIVPDKSKDRPDRWMVTLRWDVGGALIGIPARDLTKKQALTMLQPLAFAFVFGSTALAEVVEGMLR